MRFAIIENGVCVNVIEADSEFAREIRAVAIDDGCGIGDSFFGGEWTKKEQPQDPKKTAEEIKEQYEELANHFIHAKYTVDNEQAITRKIIANPDNEAVRAEFAEYNAFAEACKIKAHEQIYEKQA